MTIGKIRREKYITREMVTNDLRSLYLFGDNMQRRGRGGQAAAMRGYSNAIGVPTKYEPNMLDLSFFTDKDVAHIKVRREIDSAFFRAEKMLLAGHDIVIPADGLGTGRSQLPRRAPKVYAIIEEHIARLEAISRGSAP